VAAARVALEQYLEGGGQYLEGGEQYLEGGD